MNQDGFEGIWQQVWGQLAGQWDRPTNTPVVETAGPCVQSTGSFQERYGMSRVDVARRLRFFSERNRDWQVWNQNQ